MRGSGVTDEALARCAGSWGSIPAVGEIPMISL